MSIDEQIGIALAKAWQRQCELESHLKVLSKVVIEGNQSAALQFAMQSEGIIEDSKNR